MNNSIKNYLVNLDFEEINEIVTEQVDIWEQEGSPEEYEYECLDGEIKEGVLCDNIATEQLKEVYDKFSQEEKETCFKYVKAKCLELNGEDVSEYENVITTMEEGAEKEYKKPKLQLTGENGNAFAILGKAKRTLKKNGWSNDQINIFLKEAKSGDYQHLLSTCCEYFMVC